MYDELVKRLIEHDEYGKTLRCETGEIFKEAADAIIELEDRLAIADEDRIKFFLQIPRWIPVTERLPEHLTSVIVHRKDGGIFVWEYFNTSPTDECWIDDSMNVYSSYDVTHWMPLPEPPKEETE